MIKMLDLSIFPPGLWSDFYLFCSSSSVVQMEWILFSSSLILFSVISTPFLSPSSKFFKCLLFLFLSFSFGSFFITSIFLLRFPIFSFSFVSRKFVIDYWKLFMLGALKSDLAQYSCQLIIVSHSNCDVLGSFFIFFIT